MPTVRRAPASLYARRPTASSARTSIPASHAPRVCENSANAATGPGASAATTAGGFPVSAPATTASPSTTEAAVSQPMSFGAESVAPARAMAEAMARLRSRSGAQLSSG